METDMNEGSLEKIVNEFTDGEVGLLSSTFIQTCVYPASYTFIFCFLSLSMSSYRYLALLSTSPLRST